MNAKNTAAGKRILLAALWIYMLPLAHAQTTSANAAATTSPGTPSVFQQCAQQNNIQLPVARGEKLSQADRQIIRHCVKAARESAFQACIGEMSPPATPNQQLTKDQRHAVHKCMATKGFKKGWRHHRHGQDQDTNNT